MTAPTENTNVNHANWITLIKPTNFDIKPGKDIRKFASFVAEPLERGFGHTLGNALRRVLLSSIQGCAVIGVKIEGVTHEFESLDGVKEDVTDIILNLKQLSLRSTITEPKVISINTKGPGPVTASMIDTGHDVDVVDPDQLICTLSTDREIRIELTVMTGKGYVPASQNKLEDAPVGYIAIDATYSPVRRVSYKVVDARVGQRTDYDKLTLDVTTNGVVTPEDAVAYAARILQDQLQTFINFEESPLPASVTGGNKAAKETVDINPHLLMKVDELELSVRSANCLKNDNIVYIGDLVQRSEGDMLRTPNFGRKSLNEIKETLVTMGLGFGMQLDNWPPENIEELAARLRNNEY